MSRIDRLGRVSTLSASDLVAIFSNQLGDDAAVTLANLVLWLNDNLAPFTGILPVENGGTGTDSPGLQEGANITITGAWPNQTIASTGGGGGGGGSWGSITGTLSNQTDLQFALNQKANSANATFTGATTLGQDAGSALQAVTLQQLQAALIAIGRRARCRVATTANITISSALVTGQTLNGVTLIAGDQVLVKDQSAPSQNGVYTVGAVPARSPEFDLWSEFPGSLIAVYEGTTGADTLWLCTSNDGGTLGVTAITFVTYSAAGALLASNNLSDVLSAATARTNLGVAAATGGTMTTMTENGITSHGGTDRWAASPMGGTVIDITKMRNTYTVPASNPTLTFSGVPVDGDEWGIELTGDSASRLVTIPTSIDKDTGATVTTFVVPANRIVEIVWRRINTSNIIAGQPQYTQIAFTSALFSDDTYEGVVMSGKTAGATIAQWEAVYLNSSSTWQLADANGTGTFPARGLAVAAYVNTNPALILRSGTVRNDAWAWTPGSDIYLSTTAGGLTQTVPSTSGDKVQKVGFALDADTAYFDFGTGEYLTVT